LADGLYFSSGRMPSLTSGRTSKEEMRETLQANQNRRTYCSDSIDSSVGSLLSGPFQRTGGEKIIGFPEPATWKNKPAESKERALTKKFCIQKESSSRSCMPLKLELNRSNREPGMKGSNLAGNEKEPKAPAELSNITRTNREHCPSKKTSRGQADQRMCRSGFKWSAINNLTAFFLGAKKISSNRLGQEVRCHRRWSM